MEERYLKLTNAVYKLLEFFPEADPLKNKAKEKSLLIMESLVLLSETNGWASFQKEKTKGQLLEDIDIISGYFLIARSQGWLNASNYLIISSEYEKIKKEFKPSIELTKELPLASPLLPRQSEVTERQGKILEFLNSNGKAQVMDLQTVLPVITKRTIRRDLDELLQAGKIERLGEFNRVFYKLHQ